MFDIVTVVHNETNTTLARDRLIPSLEEHSLFPYEIHIRKNNEDNVGFAAACNEAAAWGESPYIGFLNPDSIVTGDYQTPVLQVFEDLAVVITGGNFNKNPAEIHSWGCRDWVCGAAMFVRRVWWEESGGFDERYIWSHEETDFIRSTEAANRVCRSLGPEILPILHSSPGDDSPIDSRYKQNHFAESARRFAEKWA